MSDTEVQTEADKRADVAINTMMGSMVAAAVVPAHVNWVLVSTAMGTGTVAIGLCYGVQLSRKEAWKLVKQFILGAGLTFLGINVGAKILAAILQNTGIGYAGAVALDATISTALAYAVGNTAKAYFKGERDMDELAKKFRAAFKSNMKAA